MTCNVQSISSIGDLYLEKGGKKNVKEAAKWFEIAAEKGNAKAQYELGHLYEDGRIGLWSNYNKAAYWYIKAADQTNNNAQRALARLYRIGKGVKKDYAKAYELWMKARPLGPFEKLELFWLSQETWDSHPADLVEAYKWLLLADPNGKNFPKQHDKMQSKLTPAEVAEAQKRAAEF